MQTAIIQGFNELLMCAKLLSDNDIISPKIRQSVFNITSKAMQRHQSSQRKRNRKSDVSFFSINFNIRNISIPK